MQQRFWWTDRLFLERKGRWSTKMGGHEARHFEEIRERERERVVDQRLCIIILRRAEY